MAPDRIVRLQDGGADTELELGVLQACAQEVPRDGVSGAMD